VQERSRTPANATEYQCAGGKRLYVRTLEGGQAVWLILRNANCGSSGSVPASATARGTPCWTLNGNEATVADGGPATYANCKTGGAEPAAAGK
jgi:hypothetical protein